LPKRDLGTFEDFRKARLDDVGFIVVTDDARHSSVAHKLNGRCITADNFKVRVMLDEKGTGKYYWVDSLATAGTELHASVCKVCKPHRPEKETWKT
jgi:hypothetical protein